GCRGHYIRVRSEVDDVVHALSDPREGYRPLSAPRQPERVALTSATLLPVGRSRAVVLGLALFLVGAASLGLLDATTGGDWPGWDEGWALVAFPLGIPLALYVGAGVARAESPTRVATIGTLAVWLWGAAVFVTWLVFGG